jgi:hypothetical protein
LIGKLWRPKKIPFPFAPIARNFYSWLPLLSKNEIHVYLVVTYFCWAPKTAGSGTIAISQIVELSHIPRRSVDRALNSLKARGLLKVTGSVKKPRLYEPQTNPFIAEQSYANVMAQQSQILRQQDGASLTPLEWRTPKKKESQLRIMP